MQLEVLVDSPGISVGYDVEKQWLYVDWQGEHDQETTHAACLLMLPRSLLARQAVENTGHAIEAPQVGTFDDVASAYVWLQQQQPAPQVVNRA